ncbi:hypothetical protein YB2330_002840 [Saitoella coloradoensis]
MTTSTAESINGFSIATIVIFILVQIIVIRGVNVPVFLPAFGDPSRKWVRTHFPLNLVTAPVLGVIILLISQCIGWSVVGNGIAGTDGIVPYNILILFFSLAYMAISLDLTGILQSAAFWVCNKGGSKGRVLYFYFYLLTTGLSVVLGNDPVILSGTAFLVYYTRVAEVSPISWLFSEFASCNTSSMVLFVGNPTNLVVCEGFGINYLAFTAWTILPFLACSVACYIALYIQFREEEYIPKRIYTPELDPKSVLLDPVGAIVGSAMLLTCLFVLIGASFAGVEAWEISMPFAVGKLIFDVVWDQIKFMKKRNERAEADSGRELEHVDTPKPGETVQMASSTKMAAEELDMEGLTKRSKSQDPAAAVADGDVPEADRPTAVQEDEVHPDPTATPASRPVANEQRPFVSSTIARKWEVFKHRFPTLATTLPRLPFGLLPFAFAQFILVEALAHTGWIAVFARWAAIVCGNSLAATVWFFGFMTVVLCNVSGTNIGATVLLAKIVQHANFTARTGADQAIIRGAVWAIAVGSNIGAVSFTFSASLAGLLWRTILLQKGIRITAWQFMRWNVLPIVTMAVVGFAVVYGEVKVYYGSA